ncbi:hypothetical protein GCM10010423_41640 [Streptomyces levis]|uniref:Uncharacterized protein n=1 Tax=Streptomyces levis TaxID=285566 RepID=A0ABN3NV59_9ACTN
MRPAPARQSAAGSRSDALRIARSPVRLRPGRPAGRHALYVDEIDDKANLARIPDDDRAALSTTPVVLPPVASLVPERSPSGRKTGTPAAQTEPTRAPTGRVRVASCWPPTDQCRHADNAVRHPK